VRRDVVHGLPGSGLSLLPGGGRELLGVLLSIGLASRGRGLAICGGVLPLGALVALPLVYVAGGTRAIAIGFGKAGLNPAMMRLWG